VDWGFPIGNLIEIVSRSEILPPTNKKYEKHKNKCLGGLERIWRSGYLFYTKKRTIKKKRNG